MNKNESMGRGLAWAAVFAALAISGSGCTRHVSRDITAEGASDSVIFPARDQIVLDEGTHPNRDNLRQIGPGVTKDQLYDLIGRPHFREGIAAREWDYLFHFREGDKIVTCQYKVIFDREYRGRGFHWSPADCADLLKAREASAQPQKARRFELSADALFAFGRSGIADLRPGGREGITRITAELANAEGNYRIRVVGHTDEIGGEQTNLALSRQRADSVRQLMIDQGIARDRIFAEGRGESQPVTHCAASLSLEARVDCLQPNRRVEIVADAGP